jgi:hypothetical protein
LRHLTLTHRDDPDPKNPTKAAFCIPKAVQRLATAEWSFPPSTPSSLNGILYVYIMK